MKYLVCVSSAWLCQHFPSCFSSLQKLVLNVKCFYVPSFFLEGDLSVLVTGLEHLERKSVSIIYLIIAFSVQLMILQEIVIELSKTLHI